ncbi:hypothetical protein FPV67DRAFT_1668884 [Lyophyllum atratum]|nr:hypothetical protein FPV67DRAFT_1668884 [Lyophyllum atratum]
MDPTQRLPGQRRHHPAARELPPGPRERVQHAGSLAALRFLIIAISMLHDSQAERSHKRIDHRYVESRVGTRCLGTAMEAACELIVQKGRFQALPLSLDFSKCRRGFLGAGFTGVLLVAGVTFYVAKRNIAGKRRQELEGYRAATSTAQTVPTPRESSTKSTE